MNYRKAFLIFIKNLENVLFNKKDFKQKCKN